ncbi:MAG: DNA polymerase III subunit delta [bacterium]
MGQAVNIIEQIKSGKIHPVYLLHGEETYLIEDTLDKMIKLLAPDNIRSFNLDILSSPDVSVDEILSLANTYPVMAQHRVVVVKDPSFINLKKEINALELFNKSRDAFDASDFEKSAILLAKCLDISPEEFANAENVFIKSIESFKKEYEAELSATDIEFLDDSAKNLSSYIETSINYSSLSDLDYLIEWINKGSDTTVLIIVVYSNLSSNDKLVKAVAQKGIVLNFAKLRQSTYINRDPMYQLVVDRLKAQNKNIAPDAFSELQKKTGNDMRQIFDELDKLVTFIGNRQKIEKKDVEEIVAQSDFDGIFDLTSAVAQKSLPLALAKLKSLLDKGEHPILIHTMLTRQIRFLLQVKLLIECGHLKQEFAQMNYDMFHQRIYKNLSSELINQLPESKQSNVLKQPYPLHVSLKQAKNFSVQNLIKAMEQLLEADIQLKTGTLTPELVIEMLVINLCSL